MLMNSLSSSQDGGNEIAAALVVVARRLAGRSANADELFIFFSGRGERGSSGPCGRCMIEGEPDMSQSNV